MSSSCYIRYTVFLIPHSVAGSEVHLQCDVIQCYGRCVEIDDCNQVIQAGFIKGNSGPRKFGPNEEGSSIAGTTVFVLDPAEARCEWTEIVNYTCEISFFCAAVISPNCEDGIRPSWLLWLAITLGVLFLIMLLMNIFLCTAMSCSCANTEVSSSWSMSLVGRKYPYLPLQIIEKEPSIIEEYDPYRSWHGSQYGSRYSLHGRDAHKGYTSGGSTIHSNRSDRY